MYVHFITDKFLYHCIKIPLLAYICTSVHASILMSLCTAVYVSLYMYVCIYKSFYIVDICILVNA